MPSILYHDDKFSIEMEAKYNSQNVGIQIKE